MARRRIFMKTKRALYPTFNSIVISACYFLMPNGFEKTNDATECDTLDKIRKHFANTGRVLVWQGASGDTIYGEAFTNHCFRAWHDWVYIVHNLPFTKEGELAVMRIQQEHARILNTGIYKMKDYQMDIVYKLLECEVKGQLDHFLTTGEYVKNQRAFCLEYMGANKPTIH